jgi:hypothetical protein
LGSDTEGGKENKMREKENMEDVREKDKVRPSYLRQRAMHFPPLFRASYTIACYASA